MSLDAPRANSEDNALSELRTDFSGWRFWRAVKSDGRLGEWVATRHEPGAGVSATVMRPTASLLRAALLVEREEAQMRGLR